MYTRRDNVGNNIIINGIPTTEDVLRKMLGHQNTSKKMYRYDDWIEVYKEEEM